MISKDEILSTKSISFDLIVKWFVEDVDSYKHPYKLMSKLKQIEKLFNDKNQEPIEFANWLAKKDKCGDYKHIFKSNDLKNENILGFSTYNLENNMFVDFKSTEELYNEYVDEKNKY